MTPEILAWISATRRAHKIPAGHVLEIGSRDVNGSPRGVFYDSASYVGVDHTAGPGVDWICDAETLGLVEATGQWDTVLCLETLEHCVHPWLVVEFCRQAVRPGGYLWVTTPTTGFPEHRYPVDCFRFLEDAYRLWIYAGWQLVDVSRVTDKAGYPGICAVGRPDLPNSAS